LLNRSAFVVRPYRSTEVAILATLFHRFAEPGDYTVFARQPGGEAQQLAVRVLADGGALSLNIDLASQESAPPGCCPDDNAIQLQKGGVLGLYVSEGSAAYTISIQAMGAKEKHGLLESQKMLPKGDLFAVTLVRPGDYKGTNSLNQAQMWARVQMPPVPESPPGNRAEAARRPKSDYSPAEATLVHVGASGFEPKETRIFAGQTLVFLLDADASLVVELESVDDPGQPRRRVTRDQR
jgi:hypothetical protein